MIQENALPATPMHDIVTMPFTPYYDEDGITIYNGDCRKIIPMLGSFDVTLTDPPYGMHKAEWDELIPPSEWLPLVRERSKVVAVFCGVRGIYDYPKTDWCMSWTRLASTQRMGKLKGFNNWEPVLLYGDSFTLPNDVLSFANIPDGEAGFHDTPKPLKMIRNLLGRLQGETVLDPFMGSGTTLVAARLEGRKAIGIEISERYCEAAVKRLAQKTLF